ncbi:MAG: hypothetical protein BWK80_47415 [Desulfobacteraceae bacterium IS3]|nr:MAG: hypothetical protein BWK80_47415 [Desulfobacteraceae bacterium IS3]
MSEITDRDYLDHIREAVRRTVSYTEQMTYEEFLEDIKTQDAVVRNIEIIGEAIKNLSEELRNRYSEIQWKSMAGMRDKLIHHYFGVNFSIVWKVAKEELPEIIKLIEKIAEIEKKTG